MKLVADGVLGPWPPTREVIAPVVERIRTALDSPLVVSGAAKREQVGRLVDGGGRRALRRCAR